MLREGDPQTINLYAGVATSGAMVHEELPVEFLSVDTIRILTSPGLVEGVARGDVVRVLDEEHRFEVISRAGNVAVQIFCRDGLASLEAVDLLLRSIGLGEIDGATDGIIVLTFPISATFQRIEDVIQRVVEHIDALSWQYGNVYADNGCGEPLNWWLNS